MASFLDARIERKGEKSTFVCSGPMSREEHDYLLKENLLVLGTDGEYHEKSTLIDIDSETDDGPPEEDLNDSSANKANTPPETEPTKSSKSESRCSKRTPTEGVIMHKSPIIRGKDGIPNVISSTQSTPVYDGETVSVIQPDLFNGLSLKPRRSTLSRVMKSIRGIKGKAKKSK
jgi:hypothetical protein